ncbi:hypothetical protein CBR_g4458 [Chara braunii]|uniref:Uncharacterized protein n=1 Tax=Chara braunii TaxID=69332 RepID=A0A388KHZ6_CHABU|nr:hypothetical protein CBR_g4458 [Chara braunii]|eukprot:GBG69628.1 hypothetical protein CBR_g4458 [Chara braunii]
MHNYAPNFEVFAICLAVDGDKRKIDETKRKRKGEPKKGHGERESGRNWFISGIASRTGLHVDAGQRFAERVVELTTVSSLKVSTRQREGLQYSAPHSVIWRQTVGCGNRYRNVETDGDYVRTQAAFRLFERA